MQGHPFSDPTMQHLLGLSQRGAADSPQGQPSGQITPDRGTLPEIRDQETLGKLVAMLSAAGFFPASTTSNPVPMGLAALGAVGGGVYGLGREMQADNRAAGHHFNAQGQQARTQEFGSHHPGTQGIPLVP